MFGLNCQHWAVAGIAELGLACNVKKYLRWTIGVPSPGPKFRILNWFQS